MNITDKPRWAVKYTVEDYATRIEQLEAENERLKEEMKWISVEDRLPEPDEIVLIYATVQPYIGKEYWDVRRGYLSSIDESVWCLADGYTTEVTHWWPLLYAP